MNISKIITDNIDNYYKQNKNYDSAHNGSADGVEEKHKVQIVSEPNSRNEINDREIADLIDKMNRSITGGSDRVSYSYNEKTNRIIIKIKNEDNEIIREIPSKDSIKLLEQIQEQMGIFIDKSI